MNPYEKLCNYDPRNPYFNPPVDPEDFLQEARDNCACDNCFYGRDAMALEIIRLLAHVTELEAGLEASDRLLHKFKDTYFPAVMNFDCPACSALLSRSPTP